MKAKYSFTDKTGHLWTACVECTKGSKGDKSCAAGAFIKKFAGQGCFCGILVSNLTAKTWQEEEK